MGNPLDPKLPPQDSPDSPMDNEPDTIATPEGDNENAPGQPLPSNEPPIERPRGDQPSDTK